MADENADVDLAVSLVDDDVADAEIASAQRHSKLQLAEVSLAEAERALDP